MVVHQYLQCFYGVLPLAYFFNKHQFWSFSILAMNKFVWPLVWCLANAFVLLRKAHTNTQANTTHVRIITIHMLEANGKKTHLHLYYNTEPWNPRAMKSEISRCLVLQTPRSALPPTPLMIISVPSLLIRLLFSHWTNSWRCHGHIMAVVKKCGNVPSDSKYIFVSV